MSCLVKSLGTHTKIWQPGHRLVRGVTGKVMGLVLYIKGILLKRISTYLDTFSLKLLPILWFHKALFKCHLAERDNKSKPPC